MTGEAPRVTLTPEQQREQDRDLGRMLAAYNLLMDAVVPESQYGQGVRQDDDKLALYSTALQQAAARRRERERLAGGSP